MLKHRITMQVFLYMLLDENVCSYHLCGCEPIYFCPCCFYSFKMLIIVCSVGILAFISCSVILI